MRSSLISILLNIIIFSSTSSWASEIPKTEYFTSIKSLPICRFVYNSVDHGMSATAYMIMEMVLNILVTGFTIDLRVGEYVLMKNSLFSYRTISQR